MHSKLLTHGTTTYRTDSTDVGIVTVQVHLFPIERQILEQNTHVFSLDAIAQSFFKNYSTQNSSQGLL